MVEVAGGDFSTKTPEASGQEKGVVSRHDWVTISNKITKM